jgi:hypothetical protein
VVALDHRADPKDVKTPDEHAQVNAMPATTTCITCANRR